MKDDLEPVERVLEPKVSVVVVSFNTREKLRSCLRTIEPEHEVIVVDNGSTDGSVEMVTAEFPQVRLCANQENRGFGPANNQGAQVATGDLILYLNSDAYADPGAIRCLAGVFADKEVVAAGGMLLNQDRSVQLSTANNLTLWAVFCEQTYLEMLFPNSRVFCPYWTTGRLAKSPDPQPTAQVMGASLMVRAESGRPIEAFDERYFLYCEDTDLCLRLARRGKILYVPAAKFVHDLGSSSAKDPAVGIIRYNRGKELFFRIHRGVGAALVCCLLDRTGAALRLIAWLLRWALSGFGSSRAKGQIRTFWKVLRSAHPYP